MAWPWARVCLFPLFPLLIGFWKIGHVHTRILFFSRFPLCEQRQCQTHMGPWLTWVSGIELKPCQTVYSREWWSIRNTVLSPVKSFPELWASKEKLLLYFICQHSCFCIILICFKKKNFFFFWPCYAACRILAPWSGIEPMCYLQWKRGVLTTGPPGDTPELPFKVPSFMAFSCLDFWLFPVSKISFSSNKIAEAFLHVGWISSLFRSNFLSDTDPLNSGSLHCYYWLHL